MHLIDVLVGLAALSLAITVANVAKENLGRPGWRSYILALFGIAVFAISAIVIAVAGLSWEYLFPFGYVAGAFMALNFYEKYVHSH